MVWLSMCCSKEDAHKVILALWSSPKLDYFVSWNPTAGVQMQSDLRKVALLAPCGGCICWQILHNTRFVLCYLCCFPQTSGHVHMSYLPNSRSCQLSHGYITLSPPSPFFPAYVALSVCSDLRLLPCLNAPVQCVCIHRSKGTCQKVPKPQTTQSPKRLDNDKRMIAAPHDATLRKCPHNIISPHKLR